MTDHTSSYMESAMRQRSRIISGSSATKATPAHASGGLVELLLRQPLISTRLRSTSEDVLASGAGLDSRSMAEGAPAFLDGAGGVSPPRHTDSPSANMPAPSIMDLARCDLDAIRRSFVVHTDTFTRGDLLDRFKRLVARSMKEEAEAAGDAGRKRGGGATSSSSSPATRDEMSRSYGFLNGPDAIPTGIPARHLQKARAQLIWEYEDKVQRECERLQRLRYETWRRRRITEERNRREMSKMKSGARTLEQRIQLRMEQSRRRHATMLGESSSASSFSGGEEESSAARSGAGGGGGGAAEDDGCSPYRRGTLNGPDATGATTRTASTVVVEDVALLNCYPTQSPQVVLPPPSFFLESPGHHVSGAMSHLGSAGNAEPLRAPPTYPFTWSIDLFDELPLVRETLAGGSAAGEDDFLGPTGCRAAAAASSSSTGATSSSSSGAGGMGRRRGQRGVAEADVEIPLPTFVYLISRLLFRIHYAACFPAALFHRFLLDPYFFAQPAHCDVQYYYRYFPQLAEEAEQRYKKRQSKLQHMINKHEVPIHACDEFSVYQLLRPPTRVHPRSVSARIAPPWFPLSEEEEDRQMQHLTSDERDQRRRYRTHLLNAAMSPSVRQEVAQMISQCRLVAYDLFESIDTEQRGTITWSSLTDALIEHAEVVHHRGKAEDALKTMQTNASVFDRYTVAPLPGQLSRLGYTGNAVALRHSRSMILLEGPQDYALCDGSSFMSIVIKLLVRPVTVVFNEYEMALLVKKREEDARQRIARGASVDLALEIKELDGYDSTLARRPWRNNQKMPSIFIRYEDGKRLHEDTAMEVIRQLKDKKGEDEDEEEEEAGSNLHKTRSDRADRITIESAVALTEIFPGMPMVVATINSDLMLRFYVSHHFIEAIPEAVVLHCHETMTACDWAGPGAAVHPQLKDYLLMGTRGGGLWTINLRPILGYIFRISNDERDVHGNHQLFHNPAASYNELVSRTLRGDLQPYIICRKDHLHTSVISSISMCDNGTFITASLDGDASFCRFSFIKEHMQIIQLRKFHVCDSGIRLLVSSTAAQAIAAQTVNNRVLLYGSINQKAHVELYDPVAPHFFPIVSVVIEDELDQLITADSSGYVKVWCLRRCLPLTSFYALSEQAHSAFHALLNNADDFTPTTGNFGGGMGRLHDVDEVGKKGKAGAANQPWGASRDLRSLLATNKDTITAAVENGTHLLPLRCLAYDHATKRFIATGLRNAVLCTFASGKGGIRAHTESIRYLGVGFRHHWLLSMSCYDGRVWNFLNGAMALGIRANNAEYNLLRAERLSCMDKGSKSSRMGCGDGDEDDFVSRELEALDKGFSVDTNKMPPQSIGDVIQSVMRPTTSSTVGRPGLSAIACGSAAGAAAAAASSTSGGGGVPGCASPNAANLGSSTHDADNKHDNVRNSNVRSGDILCAAMGQQERVIYYALSTGDIRAHRSDSGRLMKTYITTPPTKEDMLAAAVSYRHLYTNSGRGRGSGIFTGEGGRPDAANNSTAPNNNNNNASSSAAAASTASRLGRPNALTLTSQQRIQAVAGLLHRLLTDTYADGAVGKPTGDRLSLHMEPINMLCLEGAQELLVVYADGLLRYFPIVGHTNVAHRVVIPEYLIAKAVHYLVSPPPRRRLSGGGGSHHHHNRSPDSRTSTTTPPATTRLARMCSFAAKDGVALTASPETTTTNNNNNNTSSSAAALAHTFANNNPAAAAAQVVATHSIVEADAVSLVTVSTHLQMICVVQVNGMVSIMDVSGGGSGADGGGAAGSASTANIVHSFFSREDITAVSFLGAYPCLILADRKCQLRFYLVKGAPLLALLEDFFKSVVRDRHANEQQNARNAARREAKNGTKNRWKGGSRGGLPAAPFNPAATTSANNTNNNNNNSAEDRKLSDDRQPMCPLVWSYQMPTTPGIPTVLHFDPMLSTVYVGTKEGFLSSFLVRKLIVALDLRPLGFSVAEVNLNTYLLALKEQQSVSNEEVIRNTLYLLFGITPQHISRHLNDQQQEKEQRTSPLLRQSVAFGASNADTRSSMEANSATFLTSSPTDVESSRRGGYDLTTTTATTNMMGASTSAVSSPTTTCPASPASTSEMVAIGASSHTSAPPPVAWVNSLQWVYENCMPLLLPRLRQSSARHKHGNNNNNSISGLRPASAVRNSIAFGGTLDADVPFSRHDDGNASESSRGGGGGLGIREEPIMNLDTATLSDFLLACAVIHDATHLLNLRRTTTTAELSARQSELEDSFMLAPGTNGFDSAMGLLRRKMAETTPREDKSGTSNTNNNTNNHHRNMMSGPTTPDGAVRLSRIDIAQIRSWISDALYPAESHLLTEFAANSAKGLCGNDSRRRVASLFGAENMDDPTMRRIFQGRGGAAGGVGGGLLQQPGGRNSTTSTRSIIHTVVYEDMLAKTGQLRTMIDPSTAKMAAANLNNTARGASRGSRGVGAGGDAGFLGEEEDRWSVGLGGGFENLAFMLQQSHPILSRWVEPLFERHALFMSSNSPLSLLTPPGILERARRENLEKERKRLAQANINMHNNLNNNNNNGIVGSNTTTPTSTATPPHLGSVSAPGSMNAPTLTPVESSATAESEGKSSDLSNQHNNHLWDEFVEGTVPQLIMDVFKRPGQVLKEVDRLNTLDLGVTYITSRRNGYVFVGHADGTVSLWSPYACARIEQVCTSNPLPHSIARLGQSVKNQFRRVYQMIISQRQRMALETDATLGRNAEEGEERIRSQIKNKLLQHQVNELKKKREREKEEREQQRIRQALLDGTDVPAESVEDGSEPSTRSSPARSRAAVPDLKVMQRRMMEMKDLVQLAVSIRSGEEVRQKHLSMEDLFFLPLRMSELAELENFDPLAYEQAVELAVQRLLHDVCGDEVDGGEKRSINYYRLAHHLTAEELVRRGDSRLITAAVQRALEDPSTNEVDFLNFTHDQMVADTEQEERWDYREMEMLKEELRKEQEESERLAASSAAVSQPVSRCSSATSRTSQHRRRKSTAGTRRGGSAAGGGGGTDDAEHGNDYARALKLQRSVGAMAQIGDDSSWTAGDANFVSKSRRGSIQAPHLAGGGDGGEGGGGVVERVSSAEMNHPRHLRDQIRFSLVAGAMLPPPSQEDSLVGARPDSAQSSSSATTRVSSPAIPDLVSRCGEALERMAVEGCYKETVGPTGPTAETQRKHLERVRALGVRLPGDVAGAYEREFAHHANTVSEPPSSMVSAEGSPTRQRRASSSAAAHGSAATTCAASPPPHPPPATSQASSVSPPRVVGTRGGGGGGGGGGAPGGRVGSGPHARREPDSSWASDDEQDGAKKGKTDALTPARAGAWLYSSTYTLTQPLLLAHSSDEDDDDDVDDDDDDGRHASSSGQDTSPDHTRLGERPSSATTEAALMESYDRPLAALGESVVSGPPPPHTLSREGSEVGTTSATLPPALFMTEAHMASARGRAITPDVRASSSGASPPPPLPLGVRAGSPFGTAPRPQHRPKRPLVQVITEPHHATSTPSSHHHHSHHPDGNTTTGDLSVSDDVAAAVPMLDWRKKRRTDGFHARLDRTGYLNATQRPATAITACGTADVLPTLPASSAGRPSTMCNSGRGRLTDRHSPVPALRLPPQPSSMTWGCSTEVGKAELLLAAAQGADGATPPQPTSRSAPSPPPPPTRIMTGDVRQLISRGGTGKGSAPVNTMGRKKYLYDILPR